MRVNTLFFLTITACVCMAVAQMPYGDCCLKHVKKMNARMEKYAVRYRWQVLDGSCNLPAVIFIMKRGRLVCTDPKEQWVAELMKKIDGRKNKRHRKTSTKHNTRA